MSDAVYMVDVVSSSVKQIGWLDNKMYITYTNGRTYCYDKVPHEIYDRALTAQSVGTYVNLFIKSGGYSYTECETMPVSETVDVELMGELILGTEFSAGYDLRATESCDVPPGGRFTVQTGVKVGMPDLLCALVLPRSGLAHKEGLTVLNAPGLIDPDYEKGIGVILHNITDKEYHVASGDKIAQLLFVPFVRPNFIPVSVITPKGTRDGGFGSTGKK